MENCRALNRRLMVAVNLMDGFYYSWARRSGVSGHTLALLYALDDGQPHSQKQLSEEYLIPKTTLNTVVKACQEAGYLTLADMPGQTRQRQLCLTGAGRTYARRALEELYRAEDAAMAATLERFPEEAVAAMEYYAAQLRAAYDQQISEKEEP